MNYFQISLTSPINSLIILSHPGFHRAAQKLERFLQSRPSLSDARTCYHTTPEQHIGNTRQPRAFFSLISAPRADSSLAPPPNPRRAIMVLNAAAHFAALSAEHVWFVVSILDAALLGFVALSKLPRHESTPLLFFLLGVAATANMISAFIRFDKGSPLALVNAAILLFSGTAAFIGACRTQRVPDVDWVVSQRLEAGSLERKTMAMSEEAPSWRPDFKYLPTIAEVQENTNDIS
ncbi:hypothetical protein CYLTODRAFT_84757 [Cylindrobasidium torrendii FP15055 ss-10]|uniref:Uncharacterized protein n=1 Tax=Cylindrobasidium torrendii FP15055 ss-10 TaxID=1314674 RepID=A0A0D7B3K7_9AGAR|nr:hypothetical protein CYLTODRAFT_84757 [Cylindrobasidium torrendii FP15055 ss-10]